MGQNLTDALPDESISINTQKHIEKRFIVTPHPVYLNNPDFKLLHQKITSKKYILRVLTIANLQEKGKVQKKVFQKIANKTNYLPKLEHYIFEDQKTYCGMTTKCYLFFQIGEFTTFREEILKQGVQRAPFTQQELIKGMQSILFGLLWLRFFKESHQNINTLNIFYTNNSLMLGDPLICPISNQNPERYTSPQRQQMIEGQVQSYDSYVSDVFSVGMCMLQALKMGKMDKIYKRNNKINMQMLIQQVDKCKYTKLKDILMRILIGNAVENREKLLEMFFRLFNQKLATSQAVSQQSNKIQNKFHVLGGSKKLNAKPAEKSNNFITANQINKQQKMESRNYHNASIQLQNLISQPKLAVTSISFNMLNSHPDNSSSFSLQNTLSSKYSVPRNQYNLQFYKPQSKQSSLYLGQNNAYTKPFSRKDAQKSFSVQKLIPTNESLATPIKGLNLNFENYQRNDPLPLSHTNNLTKLDYLNKVYQKSQHILPTQSYSSFQYPGVSATASSSNPLSSFNNYSSRYQTDYLAMGSKFGINPSKIDRPPLIDYTKYEQKALKYNPSQHLFPKRISPIKKYSEKNTDKYGDHKLQSFIQIYPNKKQPQNFTVSNYKKQMERQEKKNHKEMRQQSQSEKNIASQQQINKTTPMVTKKKEENSAQNPQSSANSDFSKIIDQNILNLENGMSAAIQNSIKSLQPKPITEFNNTQKPKQNQQEAIPEDQSGEKDNTYRLQTLPMMKSQIISNEGESSIVKQNGQSLVLGLGQSVAQSIVKNSISDDDIQKYNINQEMKVVEEPPKTPIRNYNPTIQLQYNRTIPEEDPTEEQSIGQVSPNKPKGQYRQLQYQNGGKYCGFIHNNQRNGEGTFYYKDGGYYQGQWKDNAMNGYGKLFYDDGSLAYDGQWHHDQFHGRGKVYNDTASELLTPFNYETFQDYELYWRLYDGELAHDLKQGYGKLVFSNNEYYLGKFRADKPDGEGQFYSKEDVIKGLWSQGRLVKQF